MLKKTNPNLFVIGNGESRSNVDLHRLQIYGKVYGCNALYRDFTPDGLISCDWKMQHEIHSSGYCSKNKCYFRSWKRLPSEFYDMMMMTSLSEDITKELNKQLSETGLPTMEHYIHQNEKGNKKECVVQGINAEQVAYTLEMMIKKYKMNSQDVKEKLGEPGLFINWVEKEDKIEDLDQFFDGEHQGWASGPTAVRVAIEENPGIASSNVYMLGFDMKTGGNVNNIYKDTNCYISKDCKFVGPYNWIKQHLKNFENPNYSHIKFYRVIDDNSEIEEWKSCDNVKNISYSNMEELINKSI